MERCFEILFLSESWGLGNSGFLEAIRGNGDWELGIGNWGLGIGKKTPIGGDGVTGRVL